MAWKWYRPGKTTTRSPGWATKGQCIHAAVKVALVQSKRPGDMQKAQRRFDTMTSDAIASVWRSMVSDGWHVRRDDV